MFSRCAKTWNRRLCEQVIRRARIENDEFADALWCGFLMIQCVIAPHEKRNEFFYGSSTYVQD